MNTLDHVEIDSLIDINVFRIKGTGHFGVEIETREPGKVVTFDEKALATLNYEITSIMKRKDLSASDPKAAEFIEEYVSRMVRELHVSGLVEITDAPEGDTDHYKELRKDYRNR